MQIYRETEHFSVSILCPPLQEMVDSLQQRVVLLVEESSWDAERLRQVNSELLCLQSSETRLEGLVEELHAGARHGAVVAESLHAELRW